MRLEIASLAKRYLSRETLEASLASVGVVATAAAIAQAIDPTVFSDAPAFSLLGVVSWVLVLTYLVVRPRRVLRYRFPDRRHEIVLEVGDVFDAQVAVVTADQALTCEVGAVGTDSLMGQLAYRYPAGVDKLTADPGYPPSGVRLDPGAVLDLSLGGPDEQARLLVLACGRPHADGSETTWSDLSQALVGLWSGVRSRNLSEVAVPVVGSGFSGTRLTHASLLQLLLFSYFSAASDRPVARVLRIVVADEDYDWDSWLRADRLLRGLGLRKA